MTSNLRPALKTSGTCSFLMVEIPRLGDWNHTMISEPPESELVELDNEQMTESPLDDARRTLL